MTKKEIFSELGLTDDYIIHECYETEKIIFIVVSKEKYPPQITTGQSVYTYAKWKNKGEWFIPYFPADLSVYKEIHDCENSSSKYEIG